MEESVFGSCSAVAVFDRERKDEIDRCLLFFENDDSITVFSSIQPKISIPELTQHSHLRHTVIIIP